MLQQYNLILGVCSLLTFFEMSVIGSMYFFFIAKVTFLSFPRIFNPTNSGNILIFNANFSLYRNTDEHFFNSTLFLVHFGLMI